MQEEDGPLTLTIIAVRRDRLRAGGLWMYMDGLSRFLRYYRFVGCGFGLEIETGGGAGGGGGYERVAGGVLEAHIS